LERILMAREIGAMQRRIEEARARLHHLDGEDRDRGIHRFSRLLEEFEAKGGLVAEAEAKRIAASVGIGNDELGQPVRTMSGGQRRRVELARILFAETDVLLLDEPTNHLDLDAKAWLIDFLANYKGGIAGGLPRPAAARRGDHFGAVARERESNRIGATTATSWPNGIVAGSSEGEERRHQDEADQRPRGERSGGSWDHREDGQARQGDGDPGRPDEESLVEVQSKGKIGSVRFPQPEPSGRIPLGDQPGQGVR
jgi:hypothetical protein